MDAIDYGKALKRINKRVENLSSSLSDLNTAVNVIKDDNRYQMTITEESIYYELNKTYSKFVDLETCLERLYVERVGARYECLFKDIDTAIESMRTILVDIGMINNYDPEDDDEGYYNLLSFQSEIIVTRNKLNDYKKVIESYSEDKQKKSKRSFNLIDF